LDRILSLLVLTAVCGYWAGSVHDVGNCKAVKKEEEEEDFA